jgi:hypothetical protein
VTLSGNQTDGSGNDVVDLGSRKLMVPFCKLKTCNDGTRSEVNVGVACLDLMTIAMPLTNKKCVECRRSSCPPADETP